MAAKDGSTVETMSVRASATKVLVQVRTHAKRECPTCGGSGHTFDRRVSGPLLRTFRRSLDVRATAVAVVLECSPETVLALEAGRDGTAPYARIDAYVAAVVAIATEAQEARGA